MSHEGNDTLMEQLREELVDPRIRVRMKVGTNSKHEIQWEILLKLLMYLAIVTK